MKLRQFTDLCAFGTKINIYNRNGTELNLSKYDSRYNCKVLVFGIIREDELYVAIDEENGGE